MERYEIWKWHGYHCYVSLYCLVNTSATAYVYITSTIRSTTRTCWKTFSSFLGLPNHVDNIVIYIYIYIYIYGGLGFCCYCFLAVVFVHAIRKIGRIIQKAKMKIETSFKPGRSPDMWTRILNVREKTGNNIEYALLVNCSLSLSLFVCVCVCCTLVYIYGFLCASLIQAQADVLCW